MPHQGIPEDVFKKLYSKALNTIRDGHTQYLAEALLLIDKGELSGKDVPIAAIPAVWVVCAEVITELAKDMIDEFAKGVSSDGNHEISDDLRTRYDLLKMGESL